MFGREGFRGASMTAVARAAGVSKGLLHYHFRSKEHLLIEAVRATFRQLNHRFEDRFERGDRGLDTAVDALDALWAAIHDMRSWSPFMVQTLSLGTQAGPIRDDLVAFYEESDALLRQGITEVFEGDAPLQMSDARVARLVRVCLHGLVVELSLAQTQAELDTVRQSYADLRTLFSRLASTTAPEEERP
ncbi:MAG: TetR/AcrR family transcriptional regulator; helix-turn-helix transcriptional regulator [Myxococcales bacterium]|nr:TetR/AcrR family transcriptional regulator; helix-turn-helix transcriptional regulator [Myxococcales bacterium]